MIKRIFTFVLLLTGFVSYTYGQTYSGPAQGSIPSGAVVSTDNFSNNSPVIEPTNQVWNEETEFPEQDFRVNFGFPTPAEGSNYFEDRSLKKENASGLPFPFLLNDFPGIPMGNSIPPDPHIAVGPSNVIAVVNTSFRIYDKDGNILKTITANSWFNSVFTNSGAFDPKVVYDVIAQRWIMVWLQASDANHTGTLLLSVSDDSDAMGTWYNWALPANQNGIDTVDNWSDYQGVGYDQNAIYVTSQQWTFNTYRYQYAKIRIIPKEQLYNNTAGSVSWTDLWNISFPPGGSAFKIRPSYMYSNASAYYLAWAPSTGNYISLYKITNPLTTPDLTAQNIAVTSYSNAPDADQLGGSSGMLIETSGSRLKNEPKYRDGYLYIVHQVRNPDYTQFSAIHYVKIDVNTNSAVEDYVFGDDGHWFFYPAVDVDINGNVAVTYSRSGLDEYPGAFFTGKLSGDLSGFMGSVPIHKGMGNYVVDYNSGRNRWGDYNGIQLDPVEQDNFWALTEYASAINTWNTRVGKIRIQPFNGPYLMSRTDSIDFNNIEVGTTSDTLSIGLGNWGTDDVVITDIPADSGPFHSVTNLNFPITLSPYDSLVIRYVFQPTSTGIFNDLLTISSNSAGLQSFKLIGNGYQINPAIEGNFYAVSGSINSGSLYTINPLSGAGTLIGNANYDDVNSFEDITINPHTGIIYGLSTISGGTMISRVNASSGDAYKLCTLPSAVKSISFDSSGTLFGFFGSGDIYKIDPVTGSFDFVVKANMTINSAAFDLNTNKLYATLYLVIGSNKDRICTIDLVTGDTTVIGNTGFSVSTNDIDFDNSGNLYGVIGPTDSDNDFISIDKKTGMGTLIGSINYPNITGLAFARSGVTGVEEPSGDSQLPRDYVLKQNYPNPFNPSTRIEYSLPVSAGVKVTIFNLLGEVVNVLVNTQQNAGSHTIVWNSEDMNGNKVGSGVYFYELKANGTNGSDFTQIRKMILLK